jgi:hypothetical protein
LVVAQSSSEIPEELMNNPVYKLDTTIADKYQLRHRGAILKESSRPKE